MLDQISVAPGDGAVPAAPPVEPGRGVLSRVWSARPSLPDYFRDMLVAGDCPHPEHIANMI